MIRLANSFWVFACQCLFHLFCCITKLIFRAKADSESRKNDSGADSSTQEDTIACAGSTALEHYGSSNKPEAVDLFWEFLFHDDEHYTTGIEETEDSVSVETSLSPNTEKYQVLSGKDFKGFMEASETRSFTVQEFYVGSDDTSVVDRGNEYIPVTEDKGSGEIHVEEALDNSYMGSHEQVVYELNTKPEAFLPQTAEHSAESPAREKDSELMEPDVSTEHDFYADEEILSLKANQSAENNSSIEKAEDSVESWFSQDDPGKPELAVSTEPDFCENKEILDLGNDHSGENNSTTDGGFLSENQFPPESGSDSEHGASGSAEGASINYDEVVLEIHVHEEVEPGHPEVNEENELDFLEKISKSEEICIGDGSIFNGEAVIDRDKVEETDDEYIELEPNLHSSSHLDRNFLREEMESSENNHEQENSECTEVDSGDGSGRQSEGVDSPKKSWDSDSDDDDDEFDVLLQHQCLIGQMKMEMKNARARCLPTILEECETPKMAEDLGPLQINEKLERKDRMQEIHMVYKSYAEKMRKLDILNYQTVHAISFLQLKDTVQQTQGQNSSSTGIKSLLLSNLWASKSRRVYADPALKSISELHKNLEIIYVGQVCLSWEILHWQHGKANELLQYDAEGHRPYNQVAGEFQQFQVLVQRFTENEPFQGPRVPTYAKHRCELRTLLQVPAVREDWLKDKKEGRVEGEGENDISIAMLREIIGESIRVFWEFVRADRDGVNVLLKGLQADDVDLQDPSDYEFFMDIKTRLQKKEKRLKDLVRSGNCLVKMFQKHREGKEQELLFAQVEAKLVSRVLNMPRLTTEQLVWCQKKLNKINLDNRMLRVPAESSFLPFPF
ncbi:hypothetical protein NMG60_11036274 [Bertholletia excelsa]